jgi:hypothetical protein
VSFIRQEAVKKLLSVLLLLCTVNAFAANEHDWWIDNFGAEIPMVSPLNSLDLLIASPGTDSCAPLRKKILSELGDYAEAASNGKGRKAKGIADQVMKLVDFTGANPCANEGLKTYALGSYFISFPDIIHESAQWLDPAGKRVYYGGDMLSNLRPNNNLSVEFRNVLVLALLIHQNRVQFLTPSKRKELGGDWATGEVFGAYDCDSRTLSIDPVMRPFDLGATLQHEMDHFMRDQFFPASEIQRYFSSANPADPRSFYIVPNAETINWDAYLTLDETIASVEASMMQREQINDKGDVGYDYKKFKKGLFLNIKGLYIADKDFNFRMSAGPIETLFQLGNLHDPVSDLLEMSISQQSIQYVTQREIDAAAFNRTAAFEKIFDIIHSSYFAGSSLSDSIKSILKQKQSLWIDPLNNDEAYDLSTMATKSLAGYTFETKNNDLLEMYNSLTHVTESIKEVSTGCALYDEAVQSGKVSGYAGLRFSDGIGDGSGHPGENGSRTGENGARPSLSVRPCISLQGKL